MTLERATEARAVAAIRTITVETGFPPTPTELAEVLGTSERSLQSSLIRAKHVGRVGYDGDGCLVVRGADAPSPHPTAKAIRNSVESPTLWGEGA